MGNASSWAGLCRCQDLPGRQRRMANAPEPRQPFFGTAAPGGRCSAGGSGDHPHAPSQRAGLAIPTGEPFRIIAGPDGRIVIRSWTIPSGPAADFVSARSSDRMGLRLAGEPIPVTAPPERLSTPVAPGAIQVAGGQLIVLGVACGTMGGYPHIAHVISADLDRIGQLRSGDDVEFRRVTVEEARRLYKEFAAEEKALIGRVQLLVCDS